MYGEKDDIDSERETENSEWSSPREATGRVLASESAKCSES